MSDAPLFEESGDGLPARTASLFLLSAVLDRKQPLDQALETETTFKALPPRDRAFARMLTATALRRLGQIDDIILRATMRKEPPRPPLLHHILRLGVAQIAFMEAADYAAVDTSVRLAENHGSAQQKGFVNASLRHAARDVRIWLGKQDSIRLNFPEWLLKDWIETYGLSTALEIAQASLAEAPLDITPKDPGEREAWAEALEAAILPTGTLRRLESAVVPTLPGFEEGAWWVQDAAAALPAQLFGDINNAHVLDLCAAPGGKAAQLASAGAYVTALDRSPQRLMRLQQNMQRLRLQDHVTAETAEAGSWHASQPFTHILLDAPCSATGTIRRHPDLLHLKSARDVQRLADAQSRLLDHAATLLAPGGTLVYCTCSLQSAEGEAQIESLLGRNADLRRQPVESGEIGNLADLVTPAGDIRVLPFHLAAHGGMDGFYAARLRKA